MADDSLVRRVLDGHPDGRRPVGRPRLRWTDVIKRDVELLGEEHPANWRETAQDRQRWRLLVTAARDHMGLQLQE